MEMIFTFYWPNILAAFLLIIVFSFLGVHLLARNKTIEVMLLGQEFQTSILLSAFMISFFESGHHDDHGLHIEFLISGLIVLFFHAIYLFIHRRYRHLKVEGVVSFIVLLMLISQVIVSLNSNIEFHMVKSLMGDVVTVSKFEALLASVLSFFSLVLYAIFSKRFDKDTIDLALFSKLTHKKNVNLLFNILVFILMFLSIHLLGSIFTLGVLFIPAYLLQFFYLTTKKKVILFSLLGGASPLSFFLLIFNDRLAPTLFIVLLIAVITVVYGVVFKK